MRANEAVRSCDGRFRFVMQADGNLVLYRAELIRRIGLAEVERLEGPQPQRKFTIPDLREIRDKYRALAREAMSTERRGLE